MERIRFEYLFAFALLAILSAALFIFSDDAQMANLIIGAIVGGFGSITGYFFTKHDPKKK
ncbi:hypothetical protein [Peribacillus frigoritolerans]|uniref:hypothetical protein n=1 Tax=Peribacillus frigoritolerans TaxID=450367 RepID=UPI002E206B83|nr:hypothetical protein [Peribacillus frigoritolerans]MED3845507.1 hypothetical protein [Peribacillus frigoritolerans]